MLPQGVLGAFSLTRGIVKHNAFLAKRVAKKVSFNLVLIYIAIKKRIAIKTKIVIKEKVVLRRNERKWEAIIEKEDPQKV